MQLTANWSEVAAAVAASEAAVDDDVGLVQASASATGTHPYTADWLSAGGVQEILYSFRLLDYDKNKDPAVTAATGVRLQFS